MELIEREAALTVIEQAAAWGQGHNAIYDDMRDIPSVDAAPVVHGRWIKKHDNVCYWYECSECGRKPPYSEFYQEDHSRYCPNCGARMDLPEATT